jgi:hypothetical protein
MREPRGDSNAHRISEGNRNDQSGIVASRAPEFATGLPPEWKSERRRAAWKESRTGGWFEPEG